MSEVREGKSINSDGGEYMDEFERDQQEIVGGNRSHWDIFVASAIGWSTSRRSWKSTKREVIHNPNAPDPYDNMMKKLAQEHREKQQQAIAKNLKGQPI
ncbi:hypothetical protein JAO10_09065 [Burkholderia contaminans]|uniref:hypothetical protein n=1 Tax=Burkholderia cepacia complex TaxID=87882 RepID=UPI0018DC454D|nr:MULTISPECIES: hypothetical protein [Burkholderia cepacia complex]MBH9720481.1 hypothetical protein [Burkholderia contaminans]